ncbi:hypothetical protein [Streptomyces collinus]|uniref:hypothetical protein n=1 Tax=Streptomyces collinus TaxID=42684 RepID=UPI0037CFE834
MPVTPLVLLQLCAAGILLAALSRVFAKHVRAGIVLLLCPMAIDVLTRQQSMALQIADLTVSAADATTAPAAVVVVGRVITRFFQRGRASAPALMLALTVVSLSRGIAEFGLQPAVNECRPYIYFLTATLYVFTSDIGSDVTRFMLKTWVFLSLACVVICAGRWSVNGIASAGELLLVNGVLVTARPADAGPALVIAQAALTLITLRWHSRPYRALALGLLVVVVLLQHRTIWIVALVGIAAYVVLSRRMAQERISFAATALIVGTTAALGARVVSLGPTGEGLRSSYSTMQGAHSTFAWRVSGWEELLARRSGVIDALLGQPFGTGFARLIDGQIVTVSPHNFYIQTLLRLGVIGLVLFVGICLWALLAIRSNSRADVLGRILVLTQLTFCFTYALSLEQGMALGLVLVHARRSWTAGKLPTGESKAVAMGAPRAQRSDFAGEDAITQPVQGDGSGLYAPAGGRHTGSGPRQRDLSLDKGVSRQL